MSVIIYTGGGLIVRNPSSRKDSSSRAISKAQKESIWAIKNGFDDEAFYISDKKDGSIEVCLEDELRGTSPFEDGVYTPIKNLIEYAGKERLIVNGTIYVTSDWQEYNSISVIVEDNEITKVNTEIRNAETEELISELRRRGTAIKDPEDQKKIEVLMHLLSNAIGELRNSAEDWYQDQVLDLIGTTEEELRSLGLEII